MALDGSSDAYLDVGAIVDHAYAAFDASLASHDIGQDRLLRSVRARARTIPAWYRLADVIETWTDEGYLRIGVRQREFISEATVAEYSNDYEPPAPLLRVLNDDIDSAQEALNEHMRMLMGPGVLG